MRFVHDHQVEVAHPELALPAARHGVDQVEHRRVGGDEDPGGVVLFLQQVDDRGARQMLLERRRRLGHQFLPVGQEQDALDPSGPLQYVRQRDGGPRLAGAGGHDQERLALVVSVETLPDLADGPALVVPLDDLVVNQHAAQRLP